MVTHETLNSVASLDDLETLLRGEAWSDYLGSLASRPDSADEVARLRKAVAEAKTRLSPEHNDPELQSLKAQVYGGPGRAPAELRRLLARIAALREALPLRRHERIFGRLETSIGQRFTATNAGTGYSNRARRAHDLFTAFAGQTRIEGAATDRHGNAAGTGYDLGRDGAFEGHTIHVLHLYTEGGFDFSLPGAAFERKGFRVERRTRPESASSLRLWLSEARQLWLISDNKAHLGADHIEVIREFWQRGGSLYIWGDNDPYYVDANAVLGALLGPEVSMRGNTLGSKVVHELSPDNRGFLPHLITTGLVHLFEGITVASLDEGVVRGHGFSPLLYGSAGNLITVVRDPTPTGGAVAIDTAFTRLYCQWDDAGSARYVCNAACFLAAMTLPEQPEEPAPEPAKGEDEAVEPLAFDPQGAFRAPCDLTGEVPSTWLVLSIGEMADALRNTSDFVLTDPLSAGAYNCVFSDRLYAESMASWIVEQGTDPFTRRPVVGFLPLVDLSIQRNLHAFTEQLCRWLLGGKYLPTAARLLFFAVVDEMLDEARGTTRAEAWRYLYRQCLAGFTSTPEFSEMGRPVPLLDAMTAFFSPATDEMVQLRRSFASTCVIGRTLLREGRTARARVALLARRSLVKAIVGDAVAAEKAASGSVHPELTDLLYHNFCGIPQLRGGRLAAQRPSFVRTPAATQQRIERDLGEPLLPPAELTAVLHALLPLDLRQFTAETAVQRMLADSPPFAAVWRGESPGDVRTLLDTRFAPYAGPLDMADVHVSTIPPFATTYGPSVYECVCGLRFGDPAHELTPEVLASLQSARNQHFHEVYRVKGDGWYPSSGSLHYNLHRAVQSVVRSQFADAMHPTDDMVTAVAAYLRRDGKGFVCTPSLEHDIVTALQSYLRLRRLGQPHPEGVLTLAVKAQIERTLRA